MERCGATTAVFTKVAKSSVASFNSHLSSFVSGQCDFSLAPPNGIGSMRSKGSFTSLFHHSATHRSSGSDLAILPILLSSLLPWFRRSRGTSPLVFGLVPIESPCSHSLYPLTSSPSDPAAMDLPWMAAALPSSCLRIHGPWPRLELIWRPSSLAAIASPPRKYTSFPQVAGSSPQDPRTPSVPPVVIVAPSVPRPSCSLA